MLGVNATDPQNRRAVHSTAVLMLAMALSAAGNFAFQALVARHGGREAYGQAGTLLSVGAVASLLLMGVQYAVARMTALRTTSIAGCMVRGAASTWPWLLVCGVIAVAAWPSSSYLHLSGPVPGLMVSVVVLTTVLNAVPGGVLIGLQRFHAWALLAVVAVVVRILMFVALVRFLDALVAALLATATGILVAALGGAAWALIQHRSLQEAPAPAPSYRGNPAADGALGVTLSGALWAVGTLPLVFTVHSLSSSVAGEFAAAQLAASGILLLTNPLVTALYPTIARDRNMRLVGRGLAATVGVCVVTTAALAALGPFAVHTLYGSSFRPDAGLFALLALSASCISVATYLLWVSRALQVLLAPATWGILTALAAELLLGQVWTGSAWTIAFGPAVAVLAGLVSAAAVASIPRALPWPRRGVAPLVQETQP